MRQIITVSGCTNPTGQKLFYIEKGRTVQPVGFLLLHTLYYELTYAVRLETLFPWNELIPLYYLQSIRNVLEEVTGAIYQYQKSQNSQLADTQAVRLFGLCN